ncbi:hypothetical protein ASG87_16520 [Frateuria sp. Soil773]|uniref:DUF1993 domain-containing protein n=1 Tax=Frateuria sp. Soil773 TaxID=1736407 RepID=UPI0006F73085|nr:DUF1993 domain-containing protein [Frateuria sp. Soil773]KRE96590.1 hypothetical protein ASG87_16520 [Frateuria sp. Soil773]
MTISMYSASVPGFIRALTNLAHVLRKGEAHATHKQYPPEQLLQTRLTPDMLPLVRQVQIATDMATRGAARLAGVEPATFEDNEAGFAELYARIERAVDYLKTFRPDQIDGSETRAIHLKMRSGELDFEGESYLLGFVLPNLYFHCTTAYAILRQAGVGIGKNDYIGRN